MGKLFVIESGTDGSGKATQTALLYERLKKEGYQIKKVEYPNYLSDSSALVKMYLNGEFGTDPNAVNPYTCSLFYAVDRYASFKKDWEEFYRSGGIILADRYTTSNMIHQAGKIKHPDEKNKYLDWLHDLEFVKIGLPVPDKVFFLDVSPSVSQKLINTRLNKIDNQAEKDIHERNIGHLTDAYNNSQYIVDKYGWTRILCEADGKMLPKEQIHELIYEQLQKELKNEQ